MTKKKHVINPSNPYYYELIAEVTLKNDNSLNKIPRTYIIDLLIYMPQNQNVLSYEIMPHENDAAFKNETIWLHLDPENVSKKQVWGWKSYEFEIDKTSDECHTLTIDLAPITDPKPKIIYEDPIEIDPDLEPPH